ncbi:4,5-dihydroxyphthalate decarboxylase [Amycolatopsis jejuensis]|uniref:4,5-dihydroxyphthalate decarboxylase n=1 Tax=Amycolatopsis jejuensis TaxID=330084 RepID=UPI000525CFA5|nr:4,5-dihydroxyphthalate decarboxylase [Amycolatopsis jejuensis]
MSDIPVDIGIYRYDNTRALFDGTAGFEGVDATMHTADIVSDIFERTVRDREFGVAELGLTFYLRTLDLDEESPYLAIPVFPNRQFRHSAIYVNTASGIRTPQDLAGKTIGEFATYGHDAGVVAKGVLSDEYGVKPEQSRWVIGGFDWPMEWFDFVPRLHPAEVDVQPAPQGKALGQMLDDGEIDALISADVPRAVLENSPNVARLFPDYVSLERDYYRRTGIRPIMHTVVVRKDLLAQHPGLARKVYQGFVDAKETAMADYRHGRIFNHMGSAGMVPWFSELYDENRRLFGEDWWPYGVEKNRASVDAFLRWHFEQGLSKRRLTVEDIFVPELLTT